MTILKLPGRKPDILDELNALRQRRRIAYESGNTQKVSEINFDIKTFRLNNGWSEEDAHAEFIENEKCCENQYFAPVGNPFIKYDLLDDAGNPKGLSLTIGELSKFHSC